MATINGTSASDVLTASSAGDELYGFEGDDILIGGSGGDLLDGGEGSDEMAGGEGDDVYIVDSDLDLVVELDGEGTDEVRTSASWYLLPDHVENLTGTLLDYQQLNGNALDNVITGSAGWNNIDADSGDDTIVHSAGGDFASGGDGWDVYVLPGVAADYEFFSDEWGVQILDLATSECTYLLGVEELAFAGDNSSVTIDALFNRYGTAGADTLAGNSSGNFIWGYEGDDSLDGGGGADRLDGGAGADTMTGGSGDDIYHVDDSGDLVVEAADEGWDVVWVSLASYTLPDHVEMLWSMTSVSSVFTANAGGSWIGAGEGDDVLLGAAGGDILWGELGDDILDGGAGADTLTGGAGADVFAFADGDSGTGALADWICDFVTGEDQIDLSAIDADVGTNGDQAFVFIGGGAFTGTAGELRLDTDGFDSWIEGDVDGDSLADFAIMLAGAPSLLSTDILL